MLFKLLSSKDVVLEKKKTLYFFIVFLKEQLVFFYLYTLHMVNVYSICNNYIKVGEQTKPAFQGTLRFTTLSFDI